MTWGSFIGEILYKWSVGNFPSHTNHSFVSFFLHPLVFPDFQSAASSVIYSWAPVCQERSVEEVVVVAGGRVGLLAHTKTFALCIGMLDSTKGPKDFSRSPHLARNTQRELPPFLTPRGFSERAICLLCVVTATISCISPLSCKWSGDPDLLPCGENTRVDRLPYARVLSGP